MAIFRGDSFLQNVIATRASITTEDWLTGIADTPPRLLAAKALLAFWSDQGVDARKFRAEDKLNEDLHLDERCWADWDLELFGNIERETGHRGNFIATGRKVETVLDLIDEIAEYYR